MTFYGNFNPQTILVRRFCQKKLTASHPCEATAAWLEGPPEVSHKGMLMRNHFRSCMLKISQGSLGSWIFFPCLVLNLFYYDLLCCSFINKHLELNSFIHFVGSSHRLHMLHWWSWCRHLFLRSWHLLPRRTQESRPSLRCSKDLSDQNVTFEVW